MSDNIPVELLEAAQQGSREALGRLLNEFREYLLAVAHQQVPAQLQAKAGSSDIVQETFLEAQRLFHRFQGSDPEALRAWLRAILLNKIAEFHRHYEGTRKRQASREIPLSGSIEGDSSKITTTYEDQESTTPSVKIMQQEQLQQLLAAIERLPEHYQQLIRWRQWDKLSFAEIGDRLGKSEDAARMMWSRAILRLQQEMEGPK